MDSKKHSEFTGDEAQISREVGGEFKAYGGSLFGKNFELVPDKKIVQDWRHDGEGWPEGYFSKATFEFAAVEGGTELNFAHTGIPETDYEDIKTGWHDYYWEPMKEMLEG